MLPWAALTPRTLFITMLIWERAAARRLMPSFCENELNEIKNLLPKSRTIKSKYRLYVDVELVLVCGRTQTFDGIEKACIGLEQKAKLMVC
jgi:hypothetical protein